MFVRMIILGLCFCSFLGPNSKEYYSACTFRKFGDLHEKIWVTTLTMKKIFYFNSSEISTYLNKSFAHLGDYNFNKYLAQKEIENVANNEINENEKETTNNIESVKKDDEEEDNLENRNEVDWNEKEGDDFWR